MHDVLPVPPLVKLSDSRPERPDAPEPCQMFPVGDSQPVLGLGAVPSSR